MQKKVSVIIPVFNAQATIGRCIDSIFANGYDNFEIIAINDGSSDGSIEILEQYAEKYPGKIRVYNQENMGVAKTRNAGIGHATGEYVMFIDNDDYIDNDYIVTFVKEINEGGLDVVIGGYRRTDGAKTLFEMRLENFEWSKYMVMAPWAKIYRKGFLIANKLEFLDNNIGEDVYFNLQAINLTDKIAIIDYCGYNWFHNMQSVSNAKQKKMANRLDVMKLLNASYERLKEIGTETKKENEFYFTRYIIWYLLFAGRQSAYKELLAEFEKTFAWLRKNYPYFDKNKNISPFRPDGETLRNRIAVYAFVLICRARLTKMFLKLYSAKS